MSDPDVEVTETRSAGWAFRCHRCDITDVNLDERQAKARGERHVHGRSPMMSDAIEVPLWRFDVPEVPAHVTALQSAVSGRLFLRSAAPKGFDDYPGSWWACQLANGLLGPVAHITDIACYAPLVECEDPRSAP